MASDSDVSKAVICKAYSAAAAAKSLQSCPTLCDPIDGSPPGSTVLGILQARTLEWVAISFSNACKWKVKMKSLSRVQLLATPWTAAYQAPPPMGFSKQEYWSGLPVPSLKAHALVPHLLDPANWALPLLVSLILVWSVLLLLSNTPSALSIFPKDVLKLSICLQSRSTHFRASLVAQR